MSAADLQGCTNVSLTPHLSHDTTASSSCNKDDEVDHFPFLSLPFELRLEIYAYLLPPRHHKIVATIPSNYFFYNSSAPATSPFGQAPPLNFNGVPEFITYKVLTSNSHAGFPHPRICPEILRTCKQVLAEAEPVLYGGKHVIWDSGVHLEALRAFWREKSAVARGCARDVRVAFEVPQLGELDRDGEILARKALVWEKTVEYLRTTLSGIRNLDLTLWCADGLPHGLPDLHVASTAHPTPSLPPREEMHEREKLTTLNVEKQWQDNKWTRDLLSNPSLRTINITTWTALPRKAEEPGLVGATVQTFDSWIAGRMAGDRVLRNKMIADRVVSQSVVVLRGLGA